jgi:hypothetical protein
LGLLFLRLLNDDKDPFSTFINPDADELDNHAKERMKQSDEFPMQAKDKVISLAPSNSILCMFAELVYRLLQMSPTARVEGVSTIELEYPALGFRLVPSIKLNAY